MNSRSFEQEEFRLSDATSIQLQQILRELPGRRLACRAMWQGETVFAKLFLGKSAGKYANRDAAGVRALTTRGLLTPALLHESSIKDGEGYALIYQWIEGRNAEEVWQISSPGERRKLGEDLTSIVAQLHEAGLVQTDMYLRNFLVAEGAIHVLDGDGIRSFERPVGYPRSVINLAQLLSKFDVLEEDALPQWLDSYLVVRGWLQEAIQLPVLRRKIHTIRRKVAIGYAYGKVLRNCSDVVVHRRFDRFIAIRREQDSPQLRDIIENPDVAMRVPTTRSLKQGNTSTVVQVETGERNVVIKRYNIKGFRHGLNRSLRSTRARTSWSNAHLLQFYGIHTAEPLALIEWRWGWIRRQSYFISSQIIGVGVKALLADVGKTSEERSHIADQLAQLLYKLYLLRIEHGDMKASNLMLADGQLILLDLDAMRQHCWGWRFRRRHARDLRRFLKNWENAHDTRHLLETALMRHYRGDPVLALAGVGTQDISENK